MTAKMLIALEVLLAHVRCNHSTLTVGYDPALAPNAPYPVKLTYLNGAVSSCSTGDPAESLLELARSVSPFLAELRDAE